MNDLTARQAQIWLFVREHSERVGFAPSYKEIAVALELQSTNAIAYVVSRLRAKGWLRHTPSVARSLVTLIPDGMTAPVVPETTS